MHDFTKYSYTLSDIQKSVHGIGMNRKYKFLYYVYDSSDNLVGLLNNVSDAEISVDNKASIKKSLRMTYKKGDINLVGKKVKPVVRFLMPDGNYQNFPQGVYIIGDMGNAETGNSSIVDVTMYDEIKRLENEKTDFRYYISKGANYTVEIRKIIQKFSPMFTASFSSEVFGVEREWDTGTSYLQILNDILKDINFADIWTDENGIYRAKKKKTVDESTSEYTYQDNSTSIQFNGVVSNNDYFSIPNKWIVTASNPLSLPLVSTLINQDDITARGQTVTRFESIDFIANQAELNEYVRLMADNDRVTERIEFETAIVPFHEVDDIYTVINSTLGINAKYKEESWTMPLELGAKMKHVATRKVDYV